MICTVYGISNKGETPVFCPLFCEVHCSDKPELKRLISSHMRQSFGHHGFLVIMNGQGGIVYSLQEIIHQ